MSTRALCKLARRPLSPGVALLAALGILACIPNGRDSASLAGAQELVLVVLGSTLATNVSRLRTRRFAGYLRSLPLGRTNDLAGVHRLAAGVALAAGTAFYLNDCLGLATRGFNQLAAPMGLTPMPVGERPWPGTNVIVYPWIAFWAGAWIQVARGPGRPWVADVSALGAAAVLFAGPQLARRSLALGGWEDPRFVPWAVVTTLVYALLGLLASGATRARLATTPVSDLTDQPDREVRP